MPDSSGGTACTFLVYRGAFVRKRELGVMDVVVVVVRTVALHTNVRKRRTVGQTQNKSRNATNFPGRLECSGSI